MRKKILISLIFSAVILVGCNKAEEQAVIPTNTPTVEPTKLPEMSTPTLTPSSTPTAIPELKPTEASTPMPEPISTPTVTTESTETSMPTPELTNTPTPTIDVAEVPRYKETNEIALIQNKGAYGTEYFDGNQIDKVDFQKIVKTVYMQTELKFYNVQKYSIGYIKPGAKVQIAVQMEEWTQVVVEKQLVFVRTEELEGENVYSLENPLVTQKPTVTPKPTATPRPTSTPKPTAAPRPTATPTPTPGPEWMQKVYFNDYDEEEEWTGSKPDNDHTYAEAMEFVEMYVKAFEEAGYTYSSKIVTRAPVGYGTNLDFDCTYEEIFELVNKYIESSKEKENLYIWPYDKFYVYTVWSRPGGYSVDVCVGRDGEKMNRTPEEAQALLEKAFHEVGFQNYWDVFDELPEYVNPEGTFRIGSYDIYEDLLNEAYRYKKAGWSYVYFEYYETQKDGTMVFKMRVFE